MMDANLSYRTSSSRASSGVGLVILLYEQLVQDLRRALTALDSGTVETRTFELGHALEVVGQLQGRLDMQAGGEVAHNLDRFYSALSAGILDAQVKCSKPRLDGLIDDVLSLREAWLEVERKMLEATPGTEPAAVRTGRSEEGQPSSSGRKWNG
jgi:flagellar secretion chaperone FliS